MYVSIMRVKDMPGNYEISRALSDHLMWMADNKIFKSEIVPGKCNSYIINKKGALKILETIANMDSDTYSDITADDLGFVHDCIAALDDAKSSDSYVDYIVVRYA